MIPVTCKPEPRVFDAKVRQPGRRWIERHMPRGRVNKPGVALEPFWRACLKELHDAYDGVCAYSCIYVERVTGGSSTDHFVAKSRSLGLAYEWKNYRLACTTMNARKRDFEAVLDPFTMKPETFRLELVSGRIYPAPKLSARARKAASGTIDLLGLDEADCRELRARRFSDYLALRGAKRSPAAEEHLRRYSPFIYQEAARQRLL